MQRLKLYPQCKIVADFVGWFKVQVSQSELGGLYYAGALSVDLKAIPTGRVGRGMFALGRLSEYNTDRSMESECRAVGRRL